MFGITLPAVNSAARTLIGYLTVWLIAKGYITAEDSEWIATAFVAIVGGAFSLYTRRRAALVGQAAALPEVTKIVTTPELAAKVDNPTVKAA